MEPDDLTGDDWTSGMNQRLNELNAARDATAKAKSSYEISPEDHDTLQGDIERERGPLVAAKQAAMQKGLEQQKQMAMDQHAFQTSMDLESRKARVKDAQYQVGFSVNPHDIDGDTQAYTVDHEGDLVPFDHGGKKDAPPSKERDTAPSQYGNDARATPWSLLGEAVANLALGAKPENGTSPNSPDAQHTMNINVGGEQSKATFNQGAGGWQQTGQQRFNSQTGRWEDMPIGSAMGATPAAPQEAGTHGELTQGEIMSLGSKAQAAARALGLRPGTREYNSAAAGMMTHFAERLQSSKALDAEHRRQESAKVSAATATAGKKDAEAEKKETHQMRLDYGKQYDRAEQEIMGEKKEWHAAESAARKAQASALPGDENAAAGVKKLQEAADSLKQDYFDSKSMEGEVVNRAKRRMKNIHGWTDEHFKRIGVASEEKKPAPGGGGDQRVAPAGFKESAVPFPGKGGFTQHQEDRVAQPAPQPPPQAAPQQAPASTGPRNALGQVIGTKTPPLIQEAKENIAQASRFSPWNLVRKLVGSPELPESQPKRTEQQAAD